MQNTMRAHSAGQISMEGGVDVNKGHMVFKLLNGYFYNLKGQYRHDQSRISTVHGIGVMKTVAENWRFRVAW